VAQSRARRHKRSGGTARQRQRFLEKVHLNAAGIDIGSTAHWVAVPEDRDARPVRSFTSFYVGGHSEAFFRSPATLV
jgi:hypothetical protein